MSNISDQHESTNKTATDIFNSFAETVQSPSAATFSTMLYENRFLVIKTPSRGESFVIAEVFTESYSQDIVKSLQELENDKFQQ